MTCDKFSERKLPFIFFYLYLDMLYPHQTGACGCHFFFTSIWLRIIALSDALWLSALLCTTTLIRLHPWLMATSPPLVRKMNLYLIVSLPSSPGSVHCFFYSYSVFILPEIGWREIIKLYLIYYFFSKSWRKYGHKGNWIQVSKLDDVQKKFNIC